MTPEDFNIGWLKRNWWHDPLLGMGWTPHTPPAKFQPDSSPEIHGQTKQHVSSCFKERFYMFLWVNNQQLGVIRDAWFIHGGSMEPLRVDLQRNRHGNYTTTAWPLWTCFACFNNLCVREVCIGLWMYCTCVIQHELDHCLNGLQTADHNSTQSH